MNDLKKLLLTRRQDIYIMKMYIERSGSMDDRRRLTVRLSEELYKELKIYVVKKDTTINDYVLDLIQKDKDNRQPTKDTK